MRGMDPRSDLVRHYLWLRRYGLNDSHSGNASVRDGDLVWVTPTGCCADTLRPADLLPCALDGPPPGGASLDAPLHLAVYRRNPGLGAVLHSHGPHTVALTFEGGDYDPPDFEAQYYFGRVPVLPHGREAPWQPGGRRHTHCRWQGRRRGRRQHRRLRPQLHLQLHRAPRHPLHRRGREEATPLAHTTTTASLAG